MFLKKYIYSQTSRKGPPKMSSLGFHIQAGIVSIVFPICPIFVWLIMQRVLNIENAFIASRWCFRCRCSIKLFVSDMI